MISFFQGKFMDVSQKQDGLSEISSDESGKHMREKLERSLIRPTTSRLDDFEQYLIGLY